VQSLINIIKEIKQKWEDSFIPPKDQKWNNTDNSKSNNYGFKYCSYMNDTPQNRSNMDFLLKHGPNPDRTYDDYKFPWEDDEEKNEEMVMKEKLKEAIIKMLKEEIVVKRQPNDRYTCPYCNKTDISKNSLGMHILHCPGKKNSIAKKIN
jgi:hypothetical protein